MTWVRERAVNRTGPQLRIRRCGDAERISKMWLCSRYHLCLGMRNVEQLVKYLLYSNCVTCSMHALLLMFCCVVLCCVVSWIVFAKVVLIRTAGTKLDVIVVPKNAYLRIFIPPHLSLHFTTCPTPTAAAASGTLRKIQQISAPYWRISAIKDQLSHPIPIYFSW